MLGRPSLSESAAPTVAAAAALRAEGARPLEARLRPFTARGGTSLFEAPFEPDIEDVTDEQIDQVIEQLRDQQASLSPVEDRGAENEDYAVISFEGKRDGEPVEGERISIARLKGLTGPPR